MNVAEVRPDSPAALAGMLPGDEIVSVNGGPARDEIDFLFYGAEEIVRLEVRRNGRIFPVEFEGDADHGIGFEPMDLMSCGNRCLFCFVDQNPPGMRKTVAFKDEDYRLSFLRGAYVTLTTVGEADLDRIVEQRLSPLYLSVHAVDPTIRKQLLGIRRDDRLMEKIDRLAGAGITLHAQIVVCPDINDGAVLEESISALAGRYPGVASVAVVPVGLTAHREDLPPLRPVDAGHALATVKAVERLRGRFGADLGVGFAYCSDEWFIRAGLPIPPESYYDDFPQIENGVGMVRRFLDAAGRVGRRRRKPRYGNGVVLVTGVSMGPFVEAFAREAGAVSGTGMRAAVVPNRFFGESVTVSGLLTGGDIIAALRGGCGGGTVVLPPDCLNGDGRFLDDLSAEDVSRALGVEVVQGGYDPVETLFRF